ncbi:nitrate reductase [Nitrincola tapanii]|uniref:Nitrate reductase n=1 Tax=Nitrincola tapanii TaxID=1708751 RepID=A0A5A9W6E6_9GAMM|nr:nitrate reductase [Nitrincola tapanii]KAA0876370.1 nitrate reductase [Nitrincola tapanii]
MKTLTSSCPYCGVGCGVLPQVEAGRLIAISGDPQHPANFGKLCIKGSSLHETTGPELRLLQPKVDGKTSSWDEAMQSFSTRLKAIRDEHGPGSIAMYLSGQLLTEDYYVANKLMKGFLASSHVDTNSRLCMASAVAGHKRAFGADVVPGCYEDFELADLVVLVGSNAAWNHPVLFQRLLAAKHARPNMRLVVIDPRRTASCEAADLHLPIRPGTDAQLFNGLLLQLVERGALDLEFIQNHCEGFDSAFTAALQTPSDLHQLAFELDVNPSSLTRFVEWFTGTERTLTLFSQGVNQSSSGTDKVNAILNCHLATGRLGKPGSSAFSLTGQPNAMGGREVGGLANQLAAHMDFNRPEDIDRVARFWQAPAMSQSEGYKAIELFRAIDRGEIKALWIMATNPLVSMPDCEFVRRALSKCELLVVSESMAHTDTLELAHIQLPATTWGEKNGTVTNSERRISRQRPFLAPPGEARHDWQIICHLAQALGFDQAFSYQHPHEIFLEHARLSAFENDGRRAFDLSGLCHLDQTAYDALEPIQWPVNAAHPKGRARLFAEGDFFTPNRRARFIPVTPRAPQQTLDPEHPWRLNTGRIRDQWHTMTRTGRAARLLQHRPEPFIEIHPLDAQAQGLDNESLAQLRNPQGEYIGRVRLNEGQRPGELFVPMHWTRQFSAQACCDALIQPVCDPISGQPESKQGCVALQPLATTWQARVLMPAHQQKRWSSRYWSCIPLEHCQSWILADQQRVENWSDWCLEHLGCAPDLWYQDPTSGTYRAAALVDGALIWVLLVSPEGDFPDLSWLAQAFTRPLSPEDRRALLFAGPGHKQDLGALICSCFQVREASITAAIQAGLHSPQALGQALSCGTNCGSCLPEINALLAQEICHA